MYMFIVQISPWDHQTVQFTPLLLEHTLFTVSSPLGRIQHLSRYAEPRVRRQIWPDPDN